MQDDGRTLACGSLETIRIQRSAHTPWSNGSGCRKALRESRLIDQEALGICGRSALWQE